jgi:hypothetical protein
MRVWFSDPWTVIRNACTRTGRRRARSSVTPGWLRQQLSRRDVVEVATSDPPEPVGFGAPERPRAKSSFLKHRATPAAYIGRKALKQVIR